MDKELVILVPNEAAAYRAVKILHDLDKSGALELYSASVVTRDESNAVSIRESFQREPWGTVFGLSTGALVGLIGGPVGVAVGAAVGGAAGLGSDAVYSGFTGEIVREVARRLQPGTFAVCANVMEDWTVPLDEELAPIGATILRHPTDAVVAAHLEADARALKEEEAHLEAEIARTTGEARAQLESKRDEVRAKIRAWRAGIRARARALEESWDLKIASIHEKVARAEDEVRARHEAHARKLERFVAKQKAAFREL